MCSSRLIVHVRAVSRGSKHQIAGIVVLWKNLKVLVSQSYNWVSMANDSLNFIVFPLGQSGGTLRQPNYNPCWGGRPWARFHNRLNFLIQLSQGHDTDTNHAKPVRQCWRVNHGMNITTNYVMLFFFFSKLNLCCSMNRGFQVSCSQIDSIVAFYSKIICLKSRKLFLFFYMIQFAFPMLHKVVFLCLVVMQRQRVVKCVLVGKNIFLLENLLFICKWMTVKVVKSIYIRTPEHWLNQFSYQPIRS